MIAKATYSSPFWAALALILSWGFEQTPSEEQVEFGLKNLLHPFASKF